MNVQWSHIEGCFIYLCIFGCRGTDFESEWQAQRGLEEHDCSFRTVAA